MHGDTYERATSASRHTDCGVLAAIALGGKRLHSSWSLSTENSANSCSAAVRTTQLLCAGCPQWHVRFGVQGELDGGLQQGVLVPADIGGELHQVCARPALPVVRRRSLAAAAKPEPTQQHGVGRARPGAHGGPCGLQSRPSASVGRKAPQGDANSLPVILPRLASFPFTPIQPPNAPN